MNQIKFSTCSFICQRYRPGDNEGILSVFESTTTCYCLSNHSKVEAIPFSALSKDTTSKIARRRLIFTLSV